MLDWAIVMHRGSAPVESCRVAGPAVGSPNRVWPGRSPGYTLIELMIVVSLIGILATLGFLTAQGLLQRAKANATATQMAFMRTGLLNYATNCEGLPLSTKSGDPGLVTRPKGTMAILRAQSLTTTDARALAAEVAPMFGGQAKLTSSKKV